MTTKNALEIIKRRLKADPQLKTYYLKEMKKYRKLIAKTMKKGLHT